MTKFEKNEFFRLSAALVSIDSYLNDFDYILDRKIDILTTLSTNFMQEFNGDRDSVALKKSLDEKYRKDKDLVESSLKTNTVTENTSILKIKKIYEDRSEDIYDHVLIIKDKLVSDTPSSLDNIIGSIIHMSLNRIFIARPRLHELVAYYYLFKYYTSQKARNKTGIN